MIEFHALIFWPLSKVRFVDLSSVMVQNDIGSYLLQYKLKNLHELSIYVLNLTRYVKYRISSYSCRGNYSFLES